MVRSTLFMLLISLFSLTPSHLHAVDLNWSKSGDRCWFRDETRNDRHAYFIVNLEKKERSPAYNAKRLSDALSEVLKEEVTVDSLKVSRIDFTDNTNHLMITIRNKRWLLDLMAYKLTPEEPIRNINPEPRLFLPPQESRQGRDATTILIRNKLRKRVKIFWIDFSGKEHPYGMIEPSEAIHQQTYVDHSWLVKSVSGERIGCFFARRNDEILLTQDMIDQVQVKPSKQNSPQEKPSSQSPDGLWTAIYKENQLWLVGEDQEVKLSSHRSERNSFNGNSSVSRVYWSPNSKFLATIQTQTRPERTVHIIESSPQNQLQPKLHSFPYRKPGDELPVPIVRLFSIADLKEIKISNELFDNPWSLKFLKWSPDGQSFHLLYNQRGHQILRLLNVNASDGRVRSIIEEQSETFIHYSTEGKSVLEQLSPDTILWSSERSGWNHLYRYSVVTGEQLNVVTSGKWNVRRIKKIDHEQETIWFDAVGLVPDQDPYHEHFCRVNFDGSDFQILTQGDGTHVTRFEFNEKYFVDTYSRVDLAPIEELRESVTGELICQLTKEETSEKFRGRRITERFVAQGRDGVTDIWGIIHWPKEFDPNKKYPVVEYIYAGPHDHHVPKSFRSSYRHQYQVADAGMIVVQIDGMGTAWRSKKFHDVCYKNLKDGGFPDRVVWIKAAAKNFLKWISNESESTEVQPVGRMRWQPCSGTMISMMSLSLTVDAMTIGWTKSGGMNNGWAGP